MDAYSILRFFHQPSHYPDQKISEARKRLERDYPELPPIIGVLRPSSAARHNDSILRQLQAVSDRAPTNFSMTPELAVDLLAEIDADRVASPRVVRKYDPDGVKGLCFGRACALSWVAADEKSIPEVAQRKLILIGEVKVLGAPRWQFHIAPAFRTKGGEGWLVVDPDVGKPLSPSQWLHYWKAEGGEDLHENLLMFVAPTGQIAHDPQVTLPLLLDHPGLGPFFEDLRARFPTRLPPPRVRREP